MSGTLVVHRGGWEATKADLARTVVYGHHLRHDYDFDEQVAEVTPHPVRPELLGLRNLTGREWTATLGSGEQRVVPPGRSIRVEDGLAIDFGAATPIAVVGMPHASTKPGGPEDGLKNL